jgi:hypothetical protein
MKINTDVKKYLNYIKTNGDKKRKINDQEILKHFLIISVDRLITIDINAFNYTGDKLKMFVNNLINIFRISINNLKNNKELKSTIILYVRLSTIAEFSVTIDILKKIKNFDKTYEEILNDFKNKLLISESTDTNIISDDDISSSDEESSSDESWNEDIINHIFEFTKLKIILDKFEKKNHPQTHYVKMYVATIIFALIHQDKLKGIQLGEWSE